MEILLRPSVPEDVPVQRTLWSLSFGDDRAYINNFYKNYYRPDRVLVLEAEGIYNAIRRQNIRCHYYCWRHAY